MKKAATTLDRVIEQRRKAEIRYRKVTREYLITSSNSNWEEVERARAYAKWYGVKEERLAEIETEEQNSITEDEIAKAVNI